MTNVATTATGIEFKKFYADEKFWSEAAGTYHDDVLFLLNGNELPEDYDLSKAPDDSVITIECGVVFQSLLYKEGSEPSMEEYFKRWKKEQTHASFVVECDLSMVEAVQAAIKAAGGKVIS